MATPRDLFRLNHGAHRSAVRDFRQETQNTRWPAQRSYDDGHFAHCVYGTLFSAFYAPNIATELGTASGIVGGVGIAFMIASYGAKSTAASTHFASLPIIRFLS